ncbi:MAG TPA: hypothetical protein VK550_21005, partial [Polyangiaceae bacterium]|nr:hypothetical protein [Polyangiaceae bacterium]
MENRREPAHYGVGLRVGGAGMIGGLNTLLLGFDLSYRPLPWSAFGLEAELAGVDNGADPGYCIGCMRRGSSWRAFGEFRPFDDYDVCARNRSGILERSARTSSAPSGRKNRRSDEAEGAAGAATSIDTVRTRL